MRVVTRPAYSPELNPIGGLWAPIKDTLCHRVFDPLAEREAVLQTELQRFWQDARRRHSLIFDWLLAQANAASGPVIPLYEHGWYNTPFWAPRRSNHGSHRPRPTVCHPR